MERKFKERTSGSVRAEASIFIRRPLNEYTSLEEVFGFHLIEPEVSQVCQTGEISVCSYAITRESRTREPGVDEYEYKRSSMAAKNVPDEIRERAAAMVDYIDPDPDYEEEDE
jgi:hypothetical protein